MVIKILNWNLWYGKSWEKEIDFIKKINPDIVTLQEVTRHIPKFGLNKIDVYKHLKENFFGYNSAYGAQTEKLKNNKKVGHGNAIFSKFPVIKSRVYYLNKSLDWTSDYYNQSTNLLETELKIDDRKIYVFTTHLSYSDVFEDSDIKLAESEEIINILKNKSNFILTGDFNSPPKSKVIKKIIKNLNLKIQSRKPTWTLQPFEYNGFREDKLVWKLDYLFCSSDLKINSFSYPSSDLSDHLPICAEINI